MWVIKISDVQTVVSVKKNNSMFSFYKSNILLPYCFFSDKRKPINVICLTNRGKKIEGH